MHTVSRLSVLVFLCVFLNSATNLVFAPWECVAQHAAHWPFPKCTVVNCSATEPCDTVPAVIGGIVYMTCGCTSGTPTLDTCWAYWQASYPPNVMCVNAGCPTLTSCRETTKGPIWRKVCECQPFSPI